MQPSSARPEVTPSPAPTLAGSPRPSAGHSSPVRRDVGHLSVSTQSSLRCWRSTRQAFRSDQGPV